MPDWGPIGRQVYERTYARRLNGRLEEWDETVERVVAGNMALAGPDPGPGRAEAAELQVAVKAMKLLPAGRHLWLTGVAGREFLFNCHHAGWPAVEHFLFLFDSLMQGGGVGANYGADAGAEWSPASAPDLVIDGPRSFSHPIDDSREGWVDALRLYLMAASSGREECRLDMSGIRPAGAPLRTFGGTAAGPGPLIDMLREVQSVLTIRRGDDGIGWRGLMEIDHAIAACVIAGNVRRSARMSILPWGHPDAEDFLGLKAGGGHWTTNISLEVDSTFWSEAWLTGTRADVLLRGVARGMVENGEPGLYNSQLASIGERRALRATNPCGEIPLEPWEPCNLASVNLAACENREEAARLFELAARFLVRATLTPDVHELQRPVLEANRRIGVGFFGLQAWGASQYGEDYDGLARSSVLESDLRAWRARVAEAADGLADSLGVNRPVKRTTVAPTGSISSLTGDTPGIQPVFAPWYIRRVRYADDDPAVAEARREQREPDAVSARTTVVSYPCRDRILDRVDPRLVQAADDVLPESCFMMASLVQRAWAENGVSTTVGLHGDRADPEYLAPLLRRYGPGLKGVTVFAERGYSQQPLERITQDEYLRLTRERGWMADPGAVDDDCAAGGCPVGA